MKKNARGSVDGGLQGDAAALARLQRLRALSRVMDSAIRLPGGFRIGLDGLIGLIPGIGDAVGAGVSAYIILGAARLGVPKSVLARMAVNLGIETIIGSVPVVGDLFDFAFKANLRNMDLLERHAGAPLETRRRSGIWWVLTVGALIAVVVLLVWAVLTILGALIALIT